MAQALTQVREWNTGLKSTKPEMVALFVGGTSGIGKQTAIKLASAVDKPVIHIIGRSEVAGAQVIEAMKIANPSGAYSFKSVDISNLYLVDEACNELKRQIAELDFLFLSAGAVTFSKKDSLSTSYLPLKLRKNSRVISVLAGGKEIMIEEDNLDLEKKFSLSASNGYPASMTSLFFEKLAAQNPSISFLHVFPGIVATPLMKNNIGSVMGSLIGFLMKPISISAEESGEWNTWLSTSPNFAPKSSGKGAYILNHNGKDATNQALMTELREKGFPEIVWQHTQTTFDRILA
ncbi:short-chain dehydrogenases/reductase [Penicillium herquei]|nr:short-chain dehydrogenases/reductase [Penicillium herquei]